MFHVPVEKHGINGHLRQKGKIAELALGYGGSVGALKSMGALEMGLAEEELQPLVDAWRGSNPMITQLWWDVEPGSKGLYQAESSHGDARLHFDYRSAMLFITLPSGRDLLCETEARREPVWRGVGDLHGCERDEEMGTAGKLRA